MGNLTIATTFIVLLNILMWFSQIAMLDVNPAGTVCYHTKGSIIEGHTSPESQNLNANMLGNLPESQNAQVSPGGGTQYTDVFNNIIGWFKEIPGVSYVYNVVAAPYNILSCAGLPKELSAGIGTWWYLVTLLILVAFFWGRD